MQVGGLASELGQAPHEGPPHLRRVLPGPHGGVEQDRL